MEFLIAFNRIPPSPEKILQQRPATILTDAADDLGMVIEAWITGHVVYGSGTTPSGIGRPEDDRSYAGMDQRPHAHDAGFDGDVENGI